MTIEEIRAAKKNTEIEIFHVIKKLEKEINISVESVSLMLAEGIGTKRSVLVSVKLHLDLDL